MNRFKPRILVLGAGFGGLTFCQSLNLPDAQVTLVDRTNHHLFQPLLYQVATAGLAAPDIAQAVRSVLSDQPEVAVYLDAVRKIEPSESRVICDGGSMEYDFLVIALGGVTSYFGHPEWEPYAPGLKSLDDALAIRRQVLLAFEKAETEPDATRRRRLMTIAVVGGGPTGVELAGAFAELSRTVLNRDFRHIDPTSTRVLLIEGGPRVLSHLSPSLSDSARAQLEALGVEVRLKCKVKDVQAQQLRVACGDHEETIEAETILWAAGVGANPVTKELGVPLDRAGRIMVEPDLSLPGHPNVFAIGDIAHVVQADGQPVPGVSPAAMQMAQHVARIIRAEVRGDTHPRRPFVYWDKGSMATIGRSAAVAQMGSLELTGVVAWLAWLMVHLLFLIGFRNKATVLLQWAYSYCTYKRGARIIFGSGPPPGSRPSA